MIDSVASAPANGGPVIAEDNIINRKAGQDQSLYQICVNLRRRLEQVPDFEPHLQDMVEEEDEGEEVTDPVLFMWRCFRKGYPLMTLFNASNPRAPLEVDLEKIGEAKLGKAATFKFIKGCMTEFGFKGEDCFLISDLYTDDTNGFVKVAKVVNRVLDKLDERGLLYKLENDVEEQLNQEPVKLTRRQHIIEELIRTEKDYIGHLEMLQLLKKQLEETGKLTGDSVYSIFLNLNNILDFGRRFLIRIEQHDELPEAQQNWGLLFTHYKDAFGIYEPFIANNSRCTSTVEREWEKIRMIADHSRDLQQMVASVAVLSGFLLKPFQRMTRYPMMLSDLRAHGGLDQGEQADIDAAIEAIQEVLSRANSAVDQEHRRAAVTDLNNRVDDWKGIKLDTFGELLLYGNFTVLKSDVGKDTEREVRVFFDEFDPNTKAILHRILEKQPLLRVAGMTARAFTDKKRVIIRSRRSPMTPRYAVFPDLKAIFGSGSQHGRGKRFFPFGSGKSSPASPQFALGDVSPQPIFPKARRKSSIASVRALFSRRNCNEPEDGIRDVFTSHLPQTSLSPRKLRTSRAYPQGYLQTEGSSGRIFSAIHTPDGDIPPTPPIPYIPPTPSTPRGSSLHLPTTFHGPFSPFPFIHQSPSSHSQLRTLSVMSSPGLGYSANAPNLLPNSFRSPPPRLPLHLSPHSGTPSAHAPVVCFKDEHSFHRDSFYEPDSRAIAHRFDSHDDRDTGRKSKDRLSHFKEKFKGSLRIPKALYKTLKPLKSPLSVMAAGLKLMRRRKKIKMADLISDFLFDGPFSRRNTFLHYGNVVNTRSPPRMHWKCLDPFEKAVANEEGKLRPTSDQYSIYLFERILLCCKDINPAKQRPSVIGRSKEKPLANQKGKPRLQLKGRIFMANVTEIVSLSKIGSYTVQIFWKGDPGVENFIIRFQNEEVMRKWYKTIDVQRAIRSEERARQQGTSDTEFAFLKNGPKIENPYAQDAEGDFDEERYAIQHSEFPMSRNASSNSLRSRSTTGSSGGSGSTARPPRFPMPEPGLPPLSVQTQLHNTTPSPSERSGNSYFSPGGADTPNTARSSAQSGMYFPRQPTPGNNRDAENNRYTAPAMSRGVSRESQGSYYPSGRSSQRPSLQAIQSSQNPQQISIAQSRMRSASSPDIHNGNLPGPRRYPNGSSIPPVDNVPVPPIPAHVAGMRAPINRSPNQSPTNGIPLRSATQSQHSYRHPISAQYAYEQAPQRNDGRAPMTTTVANGVHPADRVTSPPINPTSSPPEPFMPGQLKAKVSFEDNYVTLVIASNIHFRSLTDRVEAKLARFTNRSIGKNSVRLRYKDEDGDFVTIDSDEAVQEAFLEWREQHRNLLAAGQMGQVGEIQLFCQITDAV